MTEKATNSPVEILLVENNPSDMELTLHALERYHIANRVQVARERAETLDYIFCADPYAHRNITDIPRPILLDLNLPKVNGLEVLERVKSDPRTKSIPVVVLTSSREERDIVQSYRLGVSSYITKPVDFDQFAEVVRQLGLYWLLLNEAPA
jgi:two-component system response regulator